MKETVTESMACLVPEDKISCHLKKYPLYARRAADIRLLARPGKKIGRCEGHMIECYIRKHMRCSIYSTRTLQSCNFYSVHYVRPFW